MVQIYEDSLAATLDGLNEALFFGESIEQDAKKEIGVWIAGRLGGPGCYSGLFAPTQRDVEEGFDLFTGERVSSGAQVRHVLGEEASRTLACLGLQDEVVRAAVMLAADKVAVFSSGDNWNGCFCCGTCNVAMLRNLRVSPVAGRERRIKTGLEHLKSCRKGDGRWKRYPFYYTILMLSEVGTQEAIEELQYADAVCDRLVSRQTGKFGLRREALLKRALAL